MEKALSNWGFQVDPKQLQVEDIKVQQFQAKQPITFQQVKVSGYLTVTDTSKFQASMQRGLGRRRTFGCGLLQVVPVMESSYF